MMIDHREEVCRLSFMGICEMIVIGKNTEENLGWCAYYVRPGSWGICATITGKKSRDEILECVKAFLTGHGAELLCNVIQSSEIYLPSAL